MGIYKEYIKNDIRSQLNYPVDFLIQLVIWSICSFLPFIALYALFTKFKNIGNWKIYECAMLYSVIVLSYDFARMIGRGFDDFHTLVQNGDIEIFLIRPHPLVLQVFASKFFFFFKKACRNNTRYFSFNICMCSFKKNTFFVYGCIRPAFHYYQYNFNFFKFIYTICRILFFLQ